jgi:hypothetical protein
MNSEAIGSVLFSALILIAQPVQSLMAPAEELHHNGCTFLESEYDGAALGGRSDGPLRPSLWRQSRASSEP